MRKKSLKYLVNERRFYKKKTRFEITLYDDCDVCEVENRYLFDSIPKKGWKLDHNLFEPPSFQNFEQISNILAQSECVTKKLRSRQQIW